MTELLDFCDLIRRVRAGDEAASAQLVHWFEPFMQRMVRIRLRQRADAPRLRREIGSSDVCQAVFQSLFRGLKANRYVLAQPRDLEALLHKMIRFNLATKARRASVKLRSLVNDFEHQGWYDPAQGPADEVADQDLIESIQSHFSEVELEILMLRLDDVPWLEISRKVNCTADAARVRLGRAVSRVRAQMSGETPEDPGEPPAEEP